LVVISLDSRCLVLRVVDEERKINKVCLCLIQAARIDPFLAEEPNLMHACKDVNMTITTESVTVIDMDNCDVCQSFTYFSFLFQMY